MRKAGNRVRITAQLIDATTGGHVWAERYDRDLTDIFAVQDEITQRIVEALKVKLTRSESSPPRRKNGSVDVAAYNYFLRGREQMYLHTRAGNINVRTFMAKAIEIEPNYAAAHATTAFIAYQRLCERLGGRPRDSRSRPASNSRVAPSRWTTRSPTPISRWPWR